MEDLNLPIIKGSQREPRVLSMDEYDDFVQFNLENFFDREAYWEWKKLIAVDVPFRITS